VPKSLRLLLHSEKRLGLVVLLAAAMFVGGLAPVAALTAAATVIDNYSTLRCSTISLNSNVVRITVAQIAGATISPATSSLSGPQGTALYFPAALTNSGNGADSFSLSVSSQSGWPVSLYRDDNGDGIHQATEQAVISGSGSLTAGKSYRCFAAVTVPSTAISGAKDTLTLTARSSFNAAITACATFTTNVQTMLSVGLAPTQALVTTAVGTKAYVGISVTNLGNIQDSISFSTTCDKGWGTAIIADTNQDGIHQTTETTRLTSLGPLVPNESRRTFVEVQVPSGLTADTQGNVVLTATSLRDSAKIARGAYGVIGKVTTAGDIDGDGSITANDVKNAVQMAIGAGTWSSAQLLRADVNSDGDVNVLDVMRILNLSKGSAVVGPNPSTGRQLALPNIESPSGITRMVYLSVNEGTQVSGIEAVVLFDSRLMSVSRITPGALMGAGSDWQISYTTTPGVVHILAYNSAGGSLAAGSGNALNIEMNMASTAPLGAASPLAWAKSVAANSSGAAFSPIQTGDGALTIQPPASLAVTAGAGTRPIAGAQVEAWLEGLLVASGLTDSAGYLRFYRLASGIYEMRISAPGYYKESLQNISAGENQIVNLGFSLVANTLANSGALEGTVTNLSGLPLNLAKVILYQNGLLVAATYTNSQGYFCRPLLIPGVYTVTVQLSAYMTAGTTALVKANEMLSKRFQLQNAIR